MSVVNTDIEYRYSGGASNSSAAACLGGAISTTTQVVNAVKNSLFDDVNTTEAASGDTEYRGIYIKNANGTTTLQDARIYISAATSSADDELDIGIAVEGVSASMATITDENTAPTSVTFSRPSTYSAGLQLNSSTGLAAGAYRGVWVRRTVNAGAAATSVTATIAVEGQTA